MPIITLTPNYCGAIGIRSAEVIRTAGVTQSSGCRFNLYDETGSTLVATIDRAAAFFRFNQITYTDGATYQVAVQAKHGDLYGVEGVHCSVTLFAAAMATRQDGGLSSNSDIEALDFKTVAYLNPFAESFKLAITSESDAPIEVRVYYIIGNLLEDKMVKATDIQAFELGNRSTHNIFRKSVILSAVEGSRRKYKELKEVELIA